MSSEYQILLDEVRQSFASAVWTHKIQEKQSDIYHAKYNKFECANIFSSALSASGILAAIFHDEVWVKAFAAVISFASLFCAAYLKSFNLKEKEMANKHCANKYAIIRNKLFHLIADIRRKNRSVEEITSDYETILSEINDLYINAPTTSSKAVIHASIALNVLKDYSYTDEEIDKFLPPGLRGRLEE